MYTRYMFHHPQQGKNAEMRTLLEEHVKSENGKGSSSNSFLITMNLPTPAMIHVIRHEDLGAMENHISNRSPEFQAYASKMQTLVSTSPYPVIHEVLASETSDKPRNYIWTTIHTPQQGAGPQVRQLLEERLQTSTKRGSSGAVLASRAFGPSGPEFALRVVFSDLATLEGYLKANQADGSLRTWATALNSVTAGPARQVLNRIVVPLPRN